MFFTAQGNKELAEVLASRKTVGPIREYNRLIGSLRESVALYIFTSAPPDFETEPKSVLAYSKLVDWSKEDWKPILKQLNEHWIIVFVNRGGMIIIDEIENEIDDYIWSFVKPKLHVKPHEGADVFEEYTDQNLLQKIKEKFSREEPLNILFVEDVVEDDEYESNVVSAMEYIAEQIEDIDIEIGETACVALLTRTSQISNIPVYGTLLSYSGGIETEWGNDNPEGRDFHDFSDIREYIEDHDS